MVTERSFERTKRKARAWAVSIFAALSFTTGHARADDVADEADHLFELGAKHYQRGEFDLALGEFLASNRLVRNRNVMFNVARCYERLGRLPDAYRYYQRALDGETEASTRALITSEITRLTAYVALLRVETNPPGALLYLHRKDLGDRGTSPQTLGLSPGKYTIIAELPGYEDAVSEAIDVQAGTTRTVHLDLTRIVGRIEAFSTDGAEVHVDAEDAKPSCVAPCVVETSPGPHSLWFSKPGFRTRRAEVHVVRSTSVTVRRPLVAETGSVVIDADERGATIQIDGQTRGFTPAVLDVALGEHVVEVSHPGFHPAERRIDVHADKQIRVDVTLLTADSVEAASRSAEAVDDAPASVSLISSYELRGMRYPTVAEALRGVRGVFISDDRGYKSAGFRGFARPGDYGNRVLVLMDGQPVNDNWLWASYIGYDLRTDLDDVSRIEVVRGPGSILYGAGAFSGVVNLVSNYANAPDGREVGVSVAEEGVARARARLTQHFGKDAGIWTSIAAGRSAGVDLFVPEYASQGAPNFGTARNVDGFQVGTLQGRVWWKSFTVQWFANHHDKQLPAGQFDTVFGDPRTHQADTRAFIEAKFTPNVARRLDWLTRVHGNYYGYDAAFAHTPENGGLEHDTFRGAWTGLEQRFVYTPSDVLKFTAGGEFQYHELAHQKVSFETVSTALDDRRDFTLLAAYGNVDVAPVERMKLTAGARYDAYSFFGGSLNPRVALIVKPTPRDNVKVLFGKAFRAPSVYELYNTSGGGQHAAKDLAPENMYSAEIEYSRRFSGNVIGTAAIYANYIEQLIALRDLPDATPSVPSYAYQNTGVPVGTVGGELEIRREWKGGWMVSASYSLQKSRYLASHAFVDFLTFAQDPKMREVPNAPNHLAAFKGAVPILDRALLLSNRITVEGPRFDRNDHVAADAPPQGKTAPALLWDIVLSGTENRYGVSYAFGVYNALDTHWTVPLSKEFLQTTMTQLGRTFLATGAVVF